MRVGVLLLMLITLSVSRSMASEVTITLPKVQVDETQIIVSDSYGENQEDGEKLFEKSGEPEAQKTTYSVKQNCWIANITVSCGGTYRTQYCDGGNHGTIIEWIDQVEEWACGE